MSKLQLSNILAVKTTNNRKAYGLNYFSAMTFIVQ